MHFAILTLIPFLILVGQTQPVFKIDAEYVRVPVTVLDEHGATVTGLTKDDFQLLDEGQTRPIENFVLDETPVHAVFLLDVSGSIQEELQEIRFAALRFAQAFSREDQISVLSFADELQVLQEWTNNYKELRKSLKKLKRGYRTALYDALLTTANEKLKTVPGKKVIILLTDGLDNESTASYAKVMNELIASSTVLYIVSRTRLIRPKVGESTRVEFLNRVMKNVLGDEEDYVDIYFRLKEASMNYLAETNGGRVFYPEKLKALGESYVQIARDIKSQYVLTFRPPRESQKKYRNLEVICSQPVARIFYRQIYRAP